LGYEFPWACGPPMEMKAAFPRPIDSEWVKARLFDGVSHGPTINRLDRRLA